MKNRKSFWRLSKTLSRTVTFRPIEDEDVKYAWAAYKAGKLADMDGVFAKDGMTAAQFKQQFELTVLTRYSGAWTMIADTPKGRMPVGFVFAFFSHKDPLLSPFMVIGDIVWCQWASKRNKIESAINFFNVIRKSIPMMDFAHGEENKRFFEMIAKHGIMQRVGTTYNVKNGEPVAIFETRTERAA